MSTMKTLFLPSYIVFEFWPDKVWGDWFARQMGVALRFLLKNPDLG